MFGYVRASKEQLGEEDYSKFCAYYCGLCREMGKSASQLSRLGLSYDMNFLAIVLSSLCDDEVKTDKKSCIAHPVKKREYVIGNAAMEYTAAMAGLLSYEKCLDDWHDDKSIKALGGLFLFRSAYKRAHKKYGNTAKYIRERLKELGVLEKQDIRDTDMAADKFALILSKLFMPSFIKDENTRRQIEWLAYNLGRWIYILDAFEDMEEDYKSKSYNPLIKERVGDIASYRASIRAELEKTLTFTLENAAAAFDLLDIKKNSELLEKMMYISLPAMQDKVLNKNITGESNGSL